jgi:hypothetical protein
VTAICCEARQLALPRETDLEVAVDDLGLATEELIFGLVCCGRPVSLELAETDLDLSAWQRAGQLWPRRGVFGDCPQ